MTADPKKYWFPAKRYGWGWGPPRCWQGWTVLLSYLALCTLGLVVFALSERVVTFLLYQLLMTAGMLLVCWQKGEPPRWRWGDDQND